MSDTGDLLRNTIYPAIYARADSAFPELRFTRRGNDWHSPLKMDGTAPKAPNHGKTKIKANKPFSIFEDTTDAKSFWDYVANRDGLADNQDILKRLAELAGTPLPSLDPEAMKRIEQARRTADIWAAIASYCQECMKTTDAAKVREYLAGRGYTPEHIEVMGLGFLPSRVMLFKYLEEKKYLKEDIDGIKKQLTTGKDGKPFPASWGIGETHKLIIPYTASGRIIGIVARITSGEKPKYCYPSGHGWRRPELFLLNAIRGDKDLVIMEGFFDALGASVVAEIENVVALGDTGLNRERIEEAKRRGARKITLCLDNDEGGQGGTENALRELKEHAPNLPVYVALLPEGKDPDDLLKEKGADTLKKAIVEAIPGWKYTLQNIINKRAGEELTEKSKAALVEELERAAVDITSPTERDEAYTLAIGHLAPYGITKESLQKATEAIRQRESLHEQDKALAGLLAEAGRLQAEGKQKDALDVLQKRSRELQARGADYSGLLVPFSWGDMKARMKTKAPALKSGYELMREDLAFPSGALSFIVGATGHGKTTFLLNALLNAALNNPDKKYYLFTFEESADAVTQKTLNVYAAGTLPGNVNNRDVIEAYFRGDEERGAVSTGFMDKEKSFRSELIEPGRVNIHYADYTAPELVEAIRYLKDHGNAGGIFIDYMQLLRKPGHWGNRQEELKEICLDLNELATAIQIPLILAAQFNRTVINPIDLHASSIGEAGDIERIASFILGIWNGDKKAIAEKEDKKLMKTDRYGINEEGLNKGKWYLEVLKNRGGRPDLHDLLDYNGNTGKISAGKARESW